MGTYRLIPHPAALPRGIKAVGVRVYESDDGKLTMRFMVNGLDALKVPPSAAPGRADDLWTATCFELFARDAGTSGYREFNFSPSRRWAAWNFDGYRHGMTDLGMASDPEISTEETAQLFILNARIDPALLDGCEAAGPCAVIEELSGRKSYWALAHGRDVPDFHDPACFAVPLV